MSPYAEMKAAGRGEEVWMNKAGPGSDRTLPETFILTTPEALMEANSA